MQPLDITQNADATLTLNSPLAELVSVTPDLWALLEGSEYVVIDRRPPGSQGQPAVTYLAITTVSHSLSYQVLRETADGYEFELIGYSER